MFLTVGSHQNMVDLPGLRSGNADPPSSTCYQWPGAPLLPSPWWDLVLLSLHSSCYCYLSQHGCISPITQHSPFSLAFVLVSKVIAILSEMQWHLNVALICISLMARGCWASLCVCVDYWYSCWELLIRLSAYFMLYLFNKYGGHSQL